MLILCYLRLKSQSGSRNGDAIGSSFNASSSVETKGNIIYLIAFFIPMFTSVGKNKPENVSTKEPVRSSEVQENISSSSFEVC